MAVKTPTGFIDTTCFTQISTKYYIYSSPAPERVGKMYDIRYSNGRWTCTCPSARELHKVGGRCKHEKALIERITAIMANRTKPERQADGIAEQAEQYHTFNLQRQASLDAMRSELAAMHEELAAIKAQPTQLAQPDLSAILAELAALRQENSEIKKALATKATARRKHQSETEAAQIKEQINSALDEAVLAANSAIACAEMARKELADLESIPHFLKQEIDALITTGKAPDYWAEDYTPPALPDDIRKSVRDAQETERTRRQRENAPLNGNQGFKFMK